MFSLGIFSYSHSFIVTLQSSYIIMRKVLGIGETVFDIILKGGQPQKAVAGGSTLNAILSVARAGVPTAFISEVGNDRLGRQIVDFLTENGVDASCVNMMQGGQSPISLAFLDEQNDADYVFYHGLSQDAGTFRWPEIAADDIIIFGSYFALSPVIRPQVKSFLEAAKSKGAILYYDINFRKAYKHEAIRLKPSLIENLELADIVRASREDCEMLYGNSHADEVYKQEIAFYCRQFVFTDGAHPVELRAGTDVHKSYTVPEISTVSTIGAGDNFNAGLAFALVKGQLTRQNIENGLSIPQWDEAISHALAFSREVCGSLDNYISEAFGQEMKQQYKDCLTSTIK